MRQEGRCVRVAISHGDINGIGYEVLLKTLGDERILELFTPIIYGSRQAEAYWREKLQLECSAWQVIDRADLAEDGRINLINLDEGHTIVLEPGVSTTQAGALAYIALERATRDVSEGLADVLITAPINKSNMPRDKFPYSGHTPYLEEHTAQEAGKSLMLLSSGDCRVALATEHIPIAEVAGQISIELIMDKVKTLEAGLIRDFGIVKPRIAVLALNPHAGDRGLIGDDEDLVIAPAIRTLSDAGYIVFGPYAADGFWASGRMDSFDAVLAMYHDQGLAPFKALYMSEGVNTTLGLKIIRTSPDHGTGYDIAGQGIASAESIRQAIYLAIDMYRARQSYDHATRNPLRRVYFNKGRDDEKLDFSQPDDAY